MKEEYLKNIVIAGLLLIVIVLAFLLVQPILKSIIIGVLLAYICNPLYKIFLKWFKSKNLAALLVCTLTLLIIILPVIFLAPSVLRQSLEVYRASQIINFVEPFNKFFPIISSSDSLAQEINSSIHAFIDKTTTSVMSSLTDALINLPVILLNLVIILFTFYFFMRDQEDIAEYMKSISPFSHEVEKKFIDQSKGIANSVIYGQVVIGILQGVIVGIGLFIFGVPHALFLMMIAVIASIIPLIGPIFIWVPAVLYLFIAGSQNAALGMLGVGIFVSTIDNILRPFVVARRTSVPTSLVIIGMIGGFFLMGILGFVMGPLILAYLLILLEIFRGKEFKGAFFESKEA